MDIRDAVVIVTGASSGIGAATARLAAANGARLVLAARRFDRLEALAAQLPDAIAVPTDMRHPEQIRDLVRAAAERYGRVDVLVNNAGQGLHVPLEQVGLDDLEAVMELNVYGPLLAMQTVVPLMRAQGGGSIVNISSGTSRMVLPGVGAYAATKAALNMLSQVARAEWAGDGIVVSLVYPSITATEFHERLRAGSVAGPTRFAPHPPERVAEAVLEAVRTGAPEIVLGHTPAPA
ncbi:MAG TPA: SDR family oxidoreductase [Micromonosporaceae bacterium]